jgi:hypothetical protein
MPARVLLLTKNSAMFLLTPSACCGCAAAHPQCFGSNTVQQYIDQAPSLEAPSCDTECAGNRFQTCGGAWSNSIYYVGEQPLLLTG